VVPEHEAKSISHETTFPRDLDQLEIVRAWLLELSEQVACRLRQRELKGRTVHLKLRFGDFKTITRAHTLSDPTDSTQVIWETVAAIVQQRLPDRHLAVRLLGVGVSGLSRHAEVQQSLFEEQERRRQRRLDDVADRIRGRFGSASLQRGLGMVRDRRDADKTSGDEDGAAP
jgi:DNA polymerase-4